MTTAKTKKYILLKITVIFNPQKYQEYSLSGKVKTGICLFACIV